ncbi:hypothetical protein [Clostridium cellulovorans]|uniref:Uncharacterized protein n=1 Tax=Clostridium cellulovorans (strain ATCC 35296 / DSM 3052 / OCM 3 / 743B) TaxID=573061 RepID=D9SRG6_CLOC7|nr:hypothetical protein [Clostridium cellulovorans]ADL52395.1 hypothetical protein Clocel_2695 [Clostridium cellulovorans 743B]
MSAKSTIGNIAAILYYILALPMLILYLPYTIADSFSALKMIVEYGFSGVDNGMGNAAVFGLFIGISLLVPAFRKIYYKLPWFFPFVKILFVDVTILGVSIMILHYGYQVKSPVRNIMFLILTIVQIVVCRILMCSYFYKKPVKHIGGSNG